MGKARTEHADHAHEVPVIMWLPLVLLAIPSVVAGWSGIAEKFLALPHEEHAGFPILPVAAALAGIALGFVLYAGKEKDPVYIPFLARKFYIDEIYAFIIRWTHDLAAKLAGFIDRWILDAAIVRGLSGGTWGLGFSLRFLQFGNIQGYAFLFGAGVVALIYYVIFK